MIIWCHWSGTFLLINVSSGLFFGEESNSFSFLISIKRSLCLDLFNLILWKLKCCRGRGKKGSLNKLVPLETNGRGWAPGVLIGWRDMLLLGDFAAVLQVGLRGICGCALFLMGWEIFTRSCWKQQTQQKNLFWYFNTVTHLLYCYSSSPKLSECLQKKKDIIEQMEVKLDMGIDRQVEI